MMTSHSFGHTPAVMVSHPIHFPYVHVYEENSGFGDATNGHLYLIYCPKLIPTMSHMGYFATFYSLFQVMSVKLCGEYKLVQAAAHNWRIPVDLRPVLLDSPRNRSSSIELQEDNLEMH